MIPLKEAEKQGFTKSTRAELAAYAKELGLENVPENADAKVLKKAVCAALGIAMEVEGRAAAQPKVTHTQGGDKIFPSYNLTPNGIWGGRRHRLTLPRPEGAKYAQAEGYTWNGKHTYYIPYDEVDNVPEPIYNIIVTNKRRRVKAERPQGAEIGELTTKWEFDSNPINYMGVDEETKNRAGSLLEWYQSRGSQFFHELSERQLMQVATKLEVAQTQNLGLGIPPRVLPTNELLGRVLEFVYGYADAKVEPDARIEA